MTTRDWIEETAATLHSARTERRPVEPLTARFPQLTVADAYQIQQAGIALRVREGAKTAGHKVGLTSEAMQRQLGVGEPDYGILLDSMIVPTGGEVAVDELIAPRVEAEIAVLMKHALAGAVTEAEAGDAIAAAVPALEIIDSRIADWRIALADTIADNASSGLAVVGETAGLGTPSELATQTVALYEDDVVVAEGNGAALLGNPLRSLAWLARTLDSHGAGINGGDIVLLGAVHASVSMQPGRTYLAVYSSWGAVQFTAS